jgi:hypothetical protein
MTTETSAQSTARENEPCKLYRLVVDFMFLNLSNRNLETLRFSVARPLLSDDMKDRREIKLGINDKCLSLFEIF